MQRQVLKKVIFLTSTQDRCAKTTLTGIGKYCQTHSPWTLFTITLSLEQIQDHKTFLPQLKSFEADGVIALTSHICKEIIYLDLPTVAWLSYRDLKPNLPAVFVDTDSSMEMGIKYFKDLGHIRFAYCGYKGAPVSTAYEHSFRKIIGNKNINSSGFIHMAKWLPISLFWKNENQLIMEWLKALPKPIALIAVEDVLAEQILTCCNVLGIDVPDQISVLGAGNNNMICKLCNPPLSSIEYGMEKGGYEIAELLDRLMSCEKMDAQMIVINPTQVVTRRSTDISLVNDPQVAEALKFIRDHITDIRQVTDITNSLAMNRRTLENKFRKVLNRSIMSEVRRVRNDLAAKMLIETNMSISQIAEIVGFSSKDHLSRAFKKGMKIPPTEYRKKYSI